MKDLTTILETVAFEYGYVAADLTGDRRTPRIVEARHFAMWFYRNYTKLSLTEIGEVFERDHGTVIHALKSLEGKFTTDAELLRQLAERQIAVQKKLQANGELSMTRKEAA